MQCGLPPEAHTSRSLTLGVNSPLCLKLSPGAMLARSSAGKRGGFPPFAPGCRTRLPPPAPRYAGDTQAVGDVSQTPLEKQKSLVTAISTGLLGPSPAHGWVWDGMPGALRHQCGGTGWGGLCLAWCHQSHRWKWGFGEKELLLSHTPFSPSCNAQGRAEWGCGAPVSPPACSPHPVLPAHAAVPPPHPSSIGNKKAFMFVWTQGQ